MTDRVARSMQLVKGMIQRLGLEEEIEQRAVSGFAATLFSDLVTRCGGYDHHEECVILQAENDVLAAPPEYCANRTRYEVALQRLQDGR